ncbi:hypothetical protein [Paludisphaera mucosa]|uniref:Uncharacterized protein n=1 Tax=Paludisphaera mucosa TaxID=3030827 RepID=A0ABT6F770_9BACT|nr:hypothetical protein [Paludisphaera mucosa]MDG3003432.1 hypothetical protein [Paludisphaera mucosa]
MRSQRARRPPFPAILTLALLGLVPDAGCSRPGTGDLSSGDPRTAPAEIDPAVMLTISPVEKLDDPRLGHLLEAASHWRRSRGPERKVVDQVVLAADVPSYLAAVAAWDQHTYFPVLIDDPTWTLPFLRAFRPSRVIRLKTESRPRGAGAFDAWLAAAEAVSRSWIRDEPETTEWPPSGSPPRWLGATPPGVVFSHPDSPSLAGAVALAAGRFQPLVRLERMSVDAASGKTPKVLGGKDVATEEQAVALARRVESRVASIAGSYARLGDDVDFLTMAGDWPYRYRPDRDSGMVPEGGCALDDLVGRVLDPGTVDLNAARSRWAYAGRLLGDPAASVYRAMASLFLQPESALLWNTYAGGSIWTDYEMNGASKILGRIRPEDAIAVRGGAAADLAAWHAAFPPDDRPGVLLINSSGGPGEFSIAGGPGTAADVPFGPPRIVSMIHSFSAADPTDAATIAGRFLERGAFLYFGSMNEPYLTAFRTPYVLSLLITAEIPLGAALRQGPFEAFGQPWRLAYLGDPLYTVDPIAIEFRPARTAPDAAATLAPPLIPRVRPDAADAAGTLDWCHEVVLQSLLQAPPEAAPVDVSEVLPALSKLDRVRLAPGRRGLLDALLIDQSIAAGEAAGLLDTLLKIPAANRSPIVWRAIESTALDRIASLSRVGEFQGLLDLWSRLVMGPWPPGSRYPAELTRRVAAAASADAPIRVGPFRRSLVEARERLTTLKILPERRQMLDEQLERIARPPGA